MAADGAALLGAAIRVAILAKAPRRTVQAVAAAVTGVLVRSVGEAVPQAENEELAEDAKGQPTKPKTGASPEELVAAFREARKGKRRRKKANRLARLRAAAPVCEALAVDEPPSSNYSSDQLTDVKSNFSPTSSPTS